MVYSRLALHLRVRDLASLPEAHKAWCTNWLPKCWMCGWRMLHSVYGVLQAQHDSLL